MKARKSLKAKPVPKARRASVKYEKPRVISKTKDDQFVDKELPFVGATSVYKTYVPARRGLHL